MANIAVIATMLIVQTCFILRFILRLCFVYGFAFEPCAILPSVSWRGNVYANIVNKGELRGDDNILVIFPVIRK